MYLGPPSDARELRLSIHSAILFSCVIANEYVPHELRRRLGSRTFHYFAARVLDARVIAATEERAE